MSQAEKQKYQMVQENSEDFIPGTRVHITVTPRNEYSRIKSVKRVSKSEWEYEVSGDHSKIEDFHDKNKFQIGKNKFNIAITNFETETFPYSFLCESEGVPWTMNVARQLWYETEETALNIRTSSIRSFTSSELGTLHMLAGRKFTMVFMKPRVEGQSEHDWLNEENNKMLTLHFKSPHENALAFCMLSHKRLGEGGCFLSLGDDNIRMICGFLMN
jgi:hypothetical protein